jgi:acetyltransferase
LDGLAGTPHRPLGDGVSAALQTTAGLTAVATAVPAGARARHAPRIGPASPRAAVPRLALLESLRLKDGRIVIVRPVMPRDAKAEGEFVTALSPLSRRLRFHGAVARLPASMLRAMTRIDQHQHVALVAQALDDSQRPHIVADARYVVDSGQPQSAEFAIAVADDWQGAGLGRLLMQRLARHARSQGLQQLHGSVLRDNHTMLALMQRLGAAALDDAEDSTVKRVTISV